MKMKLLRVLFADSRESAPALVFLPRFVSVNITKSPVSRERKRQRQPENASTEAAKHKAVPFCEGAAFLRTAER